LDKRPFRFERIFAVRPFRVLLAVSAAALVAACGDATEPAAAPSPSATASSSAAPAGGDLASLPPKEILAKAAAAIQAAETVRLKGGGSAEGESFEVDMHYGSAGQAYGTVSNSGRTIELRRVGQVVYLKADTAFWTASAGAEAAKLLGGKFLKAPLSDQRIAELASFTDKDAFVGEVLEPDGELSTGDTKEIRGTPAVGLVSKGGTAGDNGTLYVATEGEPYPLQLAPVAGSGETGSLDFLEYGEPVEVETPPAADTVDVTKLGSN
jgi:hypothetical protein